MRGTRPGETPRQILEAIRGRWGGHVPRPLGGAAYAVLCPLVEREGALELLFEVRAAAVRQGGETCFPGGRMEPGECAAACALRETWEELSIPAREIDILGHGDFLCHHRGFVLYPVAGAVSARGMAALRPAAAEVQAVFTVPVAFFQGTPPESYAYDLIPRMEDAFPYRALGLSPEYPFGRGRVEVPVWRYQGRVIWGMTARLVRSLVSCL